MLCGENFKPLNTIYRLFQNKSNDYSYFYFKNLEKLASKTGFSVHNIKFEFEWAGKNSRKYWII